MARIFFAKYTWHIYTTELTSTHLDRVVEAMYPTHEPIPFSYSVIGHNTEGERWGEGGTWARPTHA